MKTLQQLLDEKYPFESGIGPDERTHIFSLRMAFSEGYNARIAEENEPPPNDPTYDLKKVLAE